jgi:hypothetical protein
MAVRMPGVYRKLLGVPETTSLIVGETLEFLERMRAGTMKDILEYNQELIDEPVETTDAQKA